MGSIVETLEMDDPEAISGRFAEYRRYLTAVKDRMPCDAFAYATASWHYDHNDHRCPHDAWLEKLEIIEPCSGVRSEVRRIDVRMRLLGAHQDGHLEMMHTSVLSYSLTKQVAALRTGVSLSGHGDWLIDEVRLSESGTVIHEIAFRHAGRWVIECADLECRWVESK